MEEKKFEQQKRMDQIQLHIQKERLEIQKQTEIRQQKLKDILRQKQRKLLELTNRRQIRENEYVFSQNTIWGAIDNFPYSPDEDIIEDSRIYAQIGQTLKKFVLYFEN